MNCSFSFCFELGFNKNLLLSLNSVVCRDPFTRFSRVVTLLMESERELESLKCELLTQNNSSNMKDLERKLRRWEWRTHLFKKMKYNYEHAGEGVEDDRGGWGGCGEGG